MNKIHTIAHTHWDFEWYFTKQEASVQFAFHMDEVLKALDENLLDYYLLDGQSSILEDYLTSFPEKKEKVKEFISTGRLFTGPWYTQVDEMVTSGESMIRNLRLGIDYANELGSSMKVGYMPDSFGQSQDIPKIYNGFGINHAVFWRGLPVEVDARYFYWNSNDGSEVLTANIKNGYPVGADLVDDDQFMDLIERITVNNNSSNFILPVGGDQRPVDFDLKERIQLANEAADGEYHLEESNYEEFFAALEAEENDLPNISGEFIDPSTSKIHRGIYSSRYDLKQLYDRLERRMTYQVEPLAAFATYQGLENKQGMIDEIWEIIAQGQAHDSSGGCNTDKTNRDIYNRGIQALELSQSFLDYYLRKLSISVKSEKDFDLFVWNPLPMTVDEVREFEISTKEPGFSIYDSEGKAVEFDLISQSKENRGTLRRDPEEMTDDYIYISRIAMNTSVPATHWTAYTIEERKEEYSVLEETDEIENAYYKLNFKEDTINLYSKEKEKWYENFLTIEDGGDAGDTYDYSPAFEDWLITLDFKEAEKVEVEKGQFVHQMMIQGVWDLPADLEERANKETNGQVSYQLELKLMEKSDIIRFNLEIDNQVFDHRMRLVLDTDVQAENSYADTPFGVIERPVEDKHLKDWKEIGYFEEPTSMRPMIHFANSHSKDSSWTFLTKGTKDFQLIGEDYSQLAITLFRGVGYLGRPDLKRRPGDASGLQTQYVETPDSQLIGDLTIEGGIVVEEDFDSKEIQAKHLQIAQDNLFYQEQTINKFSTAIQQFRVNKAEEFTSQEIVELEDLAVTFSSLQLSKDQSGFELRLYNSKDEAIENPGKIVLEKLSTIYEMDLNGKMIKQVQSGKDMDLDMDKFKAGEIRTYGIFPR